MSGVVWAMALDDASDKAASPSLSGIQTTGLQGRSDAIDRQHVGRKPVVYLVLFREAHYVSKTVHHDLFQPPVHQLLVPEIPLPVLHPFEIGHCDTARVGENVRDDEDLLVG